VDYSPGTRAFEEVTQEWGLVALGVEGTRLSVGDVDGDGWADLFVRRGGVQADDFAPGGVRNAWLLRNTGAGFEDITQASGVLARRTPGSPLGRPFQVASFADVDNDGDLDIYTGTSTNDPEVSQGETSELLLNQGDGTFALGPADNAIRRAQAVDMPASATFVDVDRDGNVDVWLPQADYAGPATQMFQQNRLLRGIGGGLFEDVTAEYGLTTQEWTSIPAINAGLAHSRSWSGAACDLDGDGIAELLAASYGRAPNLLFRSTTEGGKTRYTNVSVASGYAYDGDQRWQDNQGAMCFCAAADNLPECAEVGQPQVQCGSLPWNHGFDREPFRLGGNSGTTVCADVNNDGHLDLYTTEIRHWWAGIGSDAGELLVNDGTAELRFSRPGNDPLGLDIPHNDLAWDEGHMTAEVFDFDNDGWPDIYVGASDYPGNRGRLYRQKAPLEFQEVSPLDFFEHNRSHGVSVADFDRDGDLDVIVGHSRARCDANAPNDCYPTMQVRAFRNTLGQAGNWLGLRLVGGGGVNGAAVGARVEVRAGAGVQTQEVDGGHGHFNTQRHAALHFGLGKACSAEVTVRWPDATASSQTFVLPAGRRFVLSPGAVPIEDTP
jgi:hypothetical protein